MPESPLGVPETSRNMMLSWVQPFPLGPGRMGLFFQYSGKRGDFNGRENEVDSGTSYFHRFSLDSDFDAFSLRLLYGLPMGGFKLGSEIQLAYRRERK